MALKFRKRLKIAPGLHINLGKRGASLSVGGRGATMNIGKNGVRSTVGIPGTGLSYSSRLSKKESKRNIIEENIVPNRRVTLLFAFGIFLLPIVFSWFTLRAGYSGKSRFFSFFWLFLFLFFIF